MSTKDKDRLVNCVEDKDGNLVVAIRMYNGINCLFHSVFGIIAIVLLVIAIVALVFSAGFLSVVPFVLSLFFWAEAWLTSNDKLKNRIYTGIFEEYLLKNSVITEPLIVIRFYPHMDKLRCMTNNGEECLYNVEYIEGKPLYIVRIHTKPERNA